MKSLGREKELETTGVLGAASVAFGLITGLGWLNWLALAFLITGLFFKSAAAALTSGWLAFAEILGKFNSRVILSLIYYLVLTPVALLFRLFSGDFLGLARKRGGSYYHPRNHQYMARDLETPW